MTPADRSGSLPRMPTTPDLEVVLSPVIDAAMREMLVPGAVVHVWVGGAPPLHRAYGTATSR